jgi:hypothetical protein
MKDKLGFEIPAHIEALWQRADETGRKIVRELHAIKLQVEKAVQDRDLIFREINQGTATELENALIVLRLIIPYAVCPLCEGDERRQTCAGCAQRGYVSKFRYERCFPRDLKEARYARLAKAG